jgi:hypothetical protein
LCTQLAAIEGNVFGLFEPFPRPPDSRSVAVFTSAVILASSAAVNSFSAKAVGRSSSEWGYPIAVDRPSSRWGGSADSPASRDPTRLENPIERACKR